jgi:RHS repeat-associated protein
VRGIPSLCQAIAVVGIHNHSPVNAATNQLTGYTYDANGNLITTGFGWDLENRMSYANAGGVQYAYDGINKRTWAGNYTCPGGFCGPGYGWQFQSETVFFFGIDGKRLAAYTPQVQYSSGTPQFIYYVLGEERVYFGGKYVGNANTSLIAGGTAVGQDRLGSAGKYFSYGEERSNLPNDQVKFATYTRDSATGLDYADQRYYAGGAGRFLSPDPYNNSAGLGDPGSWNKYTYTRGDPINRFDPDGLADAKPTFSITVWLVLPSLMYPGTGGLLPSMYNAIGLAMQAQGMNQGAAAQACEEALGFPKGLMYLPAFSAAVHRARFFHGRARLFRAARTLAVY